jgi:hypothetical protein
MDDLIDDFQMRESRQTSDVRRRTSFVVGRSGRDGNARASDDAGGERGERDDASNDDDFDDDVATEW